jgi:glycerol-3-phosphate dehydrogenase
MNPVCVIGGGGTGIACAYDLALNGIPVLLVERGEFTSGTTGRHHGQLHCGARYAVGDPDIARECMHESLILRRIASRAIEYNGGLFIALDADEVAYAEAFIPACGRAGIPARRLRADQVWELEPALSRQVRLAVEVPDGTIDAYRLPLSFLASALRLGARARRFVRAEEIRPAGGGLEVALTDLALGSSETVRASAVVNAGGPWAGMIAAAAGCFLALTPAPGTMIAVAGRMTDRVISRLRPPANGDILVPQRMQTIIGTSEWTTTNPDALQPRRKDFETLLAEGEKMLPGYARGRRISAWAAARPLAGRGSPGGSGAGRLSRNFEILHHDGEGLPGFFSVIGGKATVLRAMGEAASGAVLDYLGRKRSKSSADYQLLSWRDVFRKGAL